MIYTIEPCSGKKIEVKKGQEISVIDIDGGQVVDFFAELIGDSEEYISTGVTIDCNESLKLNLGDKIYSNKYQALLEVIYDDVGGHDLIHPCCRKEMYDFFYNNGDNHPNCFDNINKALGSSKTSITPVNLFMYTKINEDGTISVEKPLSKAGDKVILKALTDLTLGIAACSVSESKCNSGKCSAIKIEII